MNLLMGRKLPIEGKLWPLKPRKLTSLGGACVSGVD